jgi:hypothetical protein
MNSPAPQHSSKLPKPTADKKSYELSETIADAQKAAPSQEVKSSYGQKVVEVVCRAADDLPERDRGER